MTKHIYRENIQLAGSSVGVYFSLWDVRSRTFSLNFVSANSHGGCAVSGGAELPVAAIPELIAHLERIQALAESAKPAEVAP